MVGVLMGRARVADGSGQALVSPVTPAPRFIGCGWALLTGHVLEGLGDDSGGCQLNSPDNLFADAGARNCDWDVQRGLGMTLDGRGGTVFPLLMSSMIDGVTARPAARLV